MIIISAHEFYKETKIGNNNSEKIYKDKILTKGSIFSLKNRESAIKYCQEHLKKYPQNMCLLVEENNYFQLWKENPDNNQKKKSVKASKIQNNSHHTLNSEATKEFIELAKHLLSENIGPIANVICKKALAKNLHPDIQEFIDILAKNIPDVEESRQFKKTLLKFIKENMT